MTVGDTPAANATAGVPQESRFSPSVLFAVYVTAFIVAVILPWLILGVQEKIRYGSNPENLWPWITMLTPVHLAALAAVIYLSSHPFVSARRFGHSECSRLEFRIAAVVLILVTIAPALNFMGYYTRLLWFEPISPFNGDMLPLIEMGLRDFWGDHRYPYHFYEVAHWQIPLTYFPGIWLPYSAPFFLGLDIRLLEVFSFGLMVLAFLYAALPRLRFSATPLNMIEVAPVLLVPCFLFLIPAFRGFLPALHLMPFWLFIACWGVAFARRYWFVSGLFLGLCVVSRPYMAAVAPFFLTWCIWNWRANWRNVLIHGAGAAAVVLVLGLPFFLQDPKAFLYGVLEWYDFASQYHLENERWRTHGFGMSGILWELSGAKNQGLFAHKMTLAWIFEAILLAVTWNRLKSNDQLLRASAIAIFLMLYFTVIPFFYIFAAPLILLAVAQLAILPKGGAEPRKEGANGPVAFAALLSVVIFALLASVTWRNRDSAIPSTMIDNVEVSILDQLKPLNGFEQQGWFANNGEHKHRLVDANAYMGLPAVEESSPGLAVQYEVGEVVPDAILNVYLNAELIGQLSLATAPNYAPVLDIPRVNLFRGTNMIRFEVNRNGGWMSAEEVAKANIRIVRLELKPPPPLQKELTR